jgi:hypothetical protein
MNEEELVQEFIIKYTLDTNGLPCGWLDLKPSFIDYCIFVASRVYVIGPLV